MSLANKVAIVTGASSGIGAATAILFAKEGANVTMVGRNETKLKNVAEQVAKFGKKPLVVIADVAIDKEAERIIKETIDKFGKIDVLVNNAGLAKYGSITDGTFVKCYDATMAVNVRAVINLTTLAAPHLKATKGNIINISSVAALTTSPSPTMLPYAVSKAALDHFTRGAALEMSSSGVRVNSINPGPVVTDFIENTAMGSGMSWDQTIPYTALNRVSEPKEIADMAVYLAGDKAKGITGSTFVVDNGFCIKH